MKKILAIASFILTTSVSMANVSYSPTDDAQFEKTGSCPSCDLSSALIDTSFDTPAAPYNLENANLSNSTIAMRNDTLSNFSGIDGIEADFSGNDYSQATFQNAVLINADFSHANLTNANFEGANVKGANFSNANLYGAHGINFPVVKSVCDAIMPDGSTGQCS